MWTVTILNSNAKLVEPLAPRSSSSPPEAVDNGNGDDTHDRADATTHHDLVQSRPRTSHPPEPQNGVHVYTPGQNAVTVRMGFAIDLVGYSNRSAPAKIQAQNRVAALVDDVLESIGAETMHTHRQVSGDGIMLFLPPTTQIHLALHHLLRTTASWLGHDAPNLDRMRLRMAAVIGPVGPAVLGFSGGTVVHCSRLLNSRALRGALTQRSTANVAALISDPLHAFAVQEGHPGLQPDEFTRVTVRTKDFRARPWLWMSPPPVSRRFRPSISRLLDSRR